MQFASDILGCFLFACFLVSFLGLVLIFVCFGLGIFLGVDVVVEGFCLVGFVVVIFVVGFVFETYYLKCYFSIVKGRAGLVTVLWKLAYL